ncbi:hypothetical protein GF323_03060 [Candidatus Woesearchaeota archaeon]|nr:hypothetical protein [Candidatus Woesearchaeota archaeon]
MSTIARKILLLGFALSFVFLGGCNGSFESGKDWALLRIGVCEGRSALRLTTDKGEQIHHASKKPTVYEADIREAEIVAGLRKRSDEILEH